MQTYNRIALFILICNTLTLVMIYSQDLAKIKDSKPIDFNGGLNFNATGYDVKGMPSRLDPFSWTIGGNINANIYGIIDLPFSFNYTKGSKTFNQPSFNQFGASPKYKALTVHAGYRSMQFSDYTLSGVMFLGGGVEYNPEKSIVKCAFMYGQFAKAVPFDSTNQNTQYSPNLFNSPGYDRRGYGGKITLGTEENNASIILFKAWDDVHSIPNPPVSSGIRPKENLAIGFAGSLSLSERVKLKGEVSLSALTRDVRFKKREMETFSYVNNFGSIFTPRETSVSKGAYTFGINFRGDIWNWEASYKRIDPEYESLGTTYLTNDIEDYLLQVSRSLYKNKINVSLNGGFQYNNLNSQLKLTNKRNIYGANLSWVVTDNFNFNGNYSNFNSSTAPSALIIEDTFKYVQVTENYNLNTNYNFGDKRERQSISTNIAYQTVNTLNQTATLVTNPGTKLYNINISHSVSFSSININLTSSLNYNRYIMSDNTETQAYGPSLGIAKAIFNKKLKLKLNYSLLNNITTGTSADWMKVAKATAGYRLGKQHNFQLSASFLQKKVPQKQTLVKKDVSELKGNFTYGFTF